MDFDIPTLDINKRVNDKYFEIEENLTMSIEEEKLLVKKKLQTKRFSKNKTGTSYSIPVCEPKVLFCMKGTIPSCILEPV